MKIKSYKYLTEKDIEINFETLEFEITRIIGENSSINQILDEFLNNLHLYICISTFEDIPYSINTEIYSKIISDFKEYLNNKFSKEN